MYILCYNRGVNILPTEFENGWITGFIESKGVFTVNKFKIKRETTSGNKTYKYINPTFYLVSKNKPALETAKAILNMGKVSRHGDVFHLEVRKKSEVIRLSEFLEGKLKSEPRSKQFELWKKKVLEWKTRAWGKEYTAAAKQFF